MSIEKEKSNHRLMSVSHAHAHANPISLFLIIDAALEEVVQKKEAVSEYQDFGLGANFQRRLDFSSMKSDSLARCAFELA
jgi:hypothetical protein